MTAVRPSLEGLEVGPGIDVLLDQETAVVEALVFGGAQAHGVLRMKGWFATWNLAVVAAPGLICIMRKPEVAGGD